MMGKRPGRKRKQNVPRFACGQIVRQETLIMPHNVVGVIVTGDDKVGNKRGLMRIQTVLEVLNITKSQRLAGEEFIRIRDLCRRYALDAPRPNPKVSSPERGFGHQCEPSAEVIDLGDKFMKRYAGAIEVLRRSGSGVIPIVCSICFENRMPTADERPKLYRGLQSLADLWSL